MNFSFVEGIISSVGGYHQHCGDINNSVCPMEGYDRYCGLFSALVGIISSLGQGGRIRTYHYDKGLLLASENPDPVLE